MPIEHSPVPPVEVAAGTAFAVLLSLSRAVADEPGGELGEALDEVGDTTGESWLNLLGVPLDAGPPYDAERLLATLDEIDPVELRLQLLGRHAWSWASLGGVRTIEAAARSDTAAAARLLAQRRYYAGAAAASLGVLLPLPPEETRRRIRRAVAAGAEQLLGDRIQDALAGAARAAGETLAAEQPLEAVERLTGGYRYVPEPEAERVVLIPHVEPPAGLVLAQHRGARLIAYASRADLGLEARLVALGRALSDPKRVEILALVGRGVGRPAELLAETGLARSTVHHHLGLLREAGLIALEGNARAYVYVPRRAALDEAADLLSGVLAA